MNAPRPMVRVLTYTALGLLASCAVGIALARALEWLVPEPGTRDHAALLSILLACGLANARLSYLQGRADAFCETLERLRSGEPRP